MILAPPTRWSGRHPAFELSFGGNRGRGSTFLPPLSFGKNMRTLLALVFLFGLSLSAREAEVLPSASREGPVWYWRPGSSGPRMKLEVQFDRKAIFTSSFTIAHSSR